MSERVFGERFQDSRGEPIEFEDKLVHMMYSREVTGQGEVRVKRQEGRGAQPVGVRLKLDTGDLIVNGQKLKDVVLWSDTSPDEVNVSYQAKRPTLLKVWNVWRDESGVMQAWIGNSGIVVEKDEPTRATLACSSGGAPAPNFEDLVVQLYFDG